MNDWMIYGIVIVAIAAIAFFMLGNKTIPGTLVCDTCKNLSTPQERYDCATTQC